MSVERSSVIAMLVAAGLTWTTAAAAGLGAPKWVWIAAAIAGAISLIAALLLHMGGGAVETLDEMQTAGRRSAQPLRMPPATQWTLAKSLAAVSALGVVGLFVVPGIDFSSSRGEAVIVCIDSSPSTNSARASYLPDLRKVVREAVRTRTSFYAANCGANAAGTVDWPVQRTFGASSRLTVMRSAQRADEINAAMANLAKLVSSQTGSGGTSLGEVLAVMGRQCAETGDSCRMFLFTNGDWTDIGLAIRGGLGDNERKRYVKTHLPQLGGLVDSQVNFVGVGYGTTMGEARLEEARSLASELVERAGATMGAWTTRL